MTALPPKIAPKIARFLADKAPPTPCLVFDLDRVAHNFATMRAAFPQARIFYALKANPAKQVLQRLVALGACFDAASLEEIDMCLEAGATPDRISFGNTIKKAAAISRARALGIDLFVFDSEAELEKIAAHAPGARVFCRLIVGTEGAVFPLARKFGTDTVMAAELMLKAQALGLDPYGLSFHVGSQQLSPAAHEAAIGQAAMLFDELDQAGARLRMINIGGGFPARYQDDIPAIGAFAHGIHRAMAFHFGDLLPEMLVEPGRFLVGDAGVVEAEVVLVSRRARNDPTRWVYLDIGRFGGLAETEDEATRYLITTPHDGGEDGPVIIAGPTCDSADTLYEKSAYRLPLALKHGDRVQIHATGAYVSTYATTGFNGFRPLHEYYL
jgi:ornithine decarboxylase